MNKNSKNIMTELCNFVCISKEKYNPDSGEDFYCVELEHIEKKTGILNGNTQSLLQSSIKNKFNAGDVLFGKLRPNLRKYAQPNFDGVCSTEIWVLKPDLKLCSKDFLFYLVQSEKFIQTACKTAGSKMPRADWNLLSEELFYLPPLPEQRKIAAILRTWDEGIEKLGKISAIKKKRIKHLIALLFRYSNQHGQKITFGDFLKESSLPGTTGESAKKITVKLYGKGVFAKNEKIAGSASTRYFSRRAGQLIYSKLDFLNGAFGIIPNELDGFESTQDLPAFEISPTVNPLWLLAYLTRESFYKSCVSMARGQRKARRINPSDFLEMPIKVPSREVQDHIAETLKFARQDLDRTELLSTLIQTQKRGLMQKLLTGKWRVKASESEDQTC